jgi:threonine dehydrogenase-like Zn-dependent dehydrogenase
MVNLGVNKAFDRSSDVLIHNVKAATMDSKGVDAIIDAVGAGATERQVFEAFNKEGPQKYAQVWTGDEEIEVPSGVESVLFRARDLSDLEGGKNIMFALQTLLEEGKYKLPLPVKIVGQDFAGLQRGLEQVRKGVSGEKVIVVM